MRTNGILPSLALLAMLASACGPDNNGPQPASLSIESSQAADVEAGTLLVVKDMGTLVRVVGRGEDGKEVPLDPGSITWESSNSEEVEVTPLGGSCVIKGLRDWFDTVAEGADPSTGHEPSAQVTVRYDDLQAALPTAVVLNGDGMWQIKITGGALNGIMLPLELVQHGRTLLHEATGATAKIVGRTFSIAQLGYSFEGNFTTRTKVEGVYMDDSGGQGTWTAEKQ